MEWNLCSRPGRYHLWGDLNKAGCQLEASGLVPVTRKRGSDIDLDL